MDIKSKLDKEISQRDIRPRGIRFGVTAFNDLESTGDITRGAGGPSVLEEWASNIPWYSSDIYAWCDPSFNGDYELPPT